MSLQGYIFLENKNYLKIKKEKFLNYNDIYIYYLQKILHDILVMFFKKYTVIEMF